MMKKIMVQKAFDAPELIEVLEHLCGTQSVCGTVLVIDSMSSIFDLLVGLGYSTVNFHAENIISCLRRIAIKKNTIVFFTTVPGANGMVDKRFSQWSTHSICINREEVECSEEIGMRIITNPHRFIRVTAINSDDTTKKDQMRRDNQKLTFKVKLSDDGMIIV